MILTVGKYNLVTNQLNIQQWDVEENGAFYQILRTSSHNPAEEQPQQLCKNSVILKQPLEEVRLIQGKNQLIIYTANKKNPVSYIKKQMKDYIYKLADFSHTEISLLSGQELQNEKLDFLHEEERD